MRKIIAALIFIIILSILGLCGFSQSKDNKAQGFKTEATEKYKDSVSQKYDTVFVFRANDIAALKSLLMNAKLVGEDGQPLSGNQLVQLMSWIDSRITLIPKQQPKK